jgi:hypothetical protein
MTARDWEPGDPLYDHPNERGLGDGTYVRHLFDIVRDEEAAVAAMLDGVHQVAVCARCLVGWQANDGPDCWVCGKHATNYDEALENEVRRRADCAKVAVLTGHGRERQRVNLSYYHYSEPGVAYMDEVESGAWYVPYNDTWALGVVRRHRFVRTDQWDNHRSGYVYQYDGVEEETDE